MFAFCVLLFAYDRLQVQLKLGVPTVPASATPATTARPEPAGGSAGGWGTAPVAGRLGAGRLFGRRFQLGRFTAAARRQPAPQRAQPLRVDEEAVLPQPTHPWWVRTLLLVLAISSVDMPLCVFCVLFWFLFLAPAPGERPARGFGAKSRLEYKFSLKAHWRTKAIRVFCCIARACGGSAIKSHYLT